VATWPADSISSGFVYVTDAAPDNPEEGETWYDLGTNEAKVYDGVEWHLLTVTDHSEVGGVQAGQHRSDANIQSVVDGQVDADTVDGQHASQLGGSFATTVVREREDGGSGNSRSGTTHHSNGIILFARVVQGNSNGDSNAANGYLRFNFEDGDSVKIGRGAYTSGSGSKSERHIYNSRSGQTALIDSVDWHVDGNSYGDYIDVNYAIAEL
jgi:hypothetical protein